MTIVQTSVASIAPTDRARHQLTGMLALSLALTVVIIGSLAIGAKPISAATVLDALSTHDGSVPDHIIVRELRLPRTILGLAAGSALGASGALMQGLTRNPLADPGLLGVNAGAAFAVVLGIRWFGTDSTVGLVWFALTGAAVVSVLVYTLGSIGRGGPTPLRLTLAGAAASALLLSLTRAVTLLDQATLDRFRFWAVGSLSGPDGDVVGPTVPFILGGLLLAITATRPLNALALGDEAARALGVSLTRTRVCVGMAITLLCGAAVAAAGPIGFVGLVVPHAMRAWFGPDQRWLVPASALSGAGLLLFADITGRVIARPGEVQVGIMTAVIGGPAFVILVRRTRLAQL